MRNVVLFGWCAALLMGCAAHVTADDGSFDGGSRLPDGAIRPGEGDGGPDVRFRDVPVSYDVFREDVCAPEAGMGVRRYDCDPFRPTTSCPAGQGCYPYTEYPDGPCGREVYRAVCFMAGTIPVDGFCGGGELCAPGLSCFVTGSGNRCLRLCRIDGSEPSCPRGQVCEPSDLPDFGACD